MTLRAQDAVSAYARTEQGPQMARQPLTRVSDVMTRGALTVTPTMRVHDAWHLLSEHHIGQAPVLNAQGHVVGLLLRSDIAPQELLPAPGSMGEQLALVRRLVAEAMVSPVPTVSVDTELRRVAQVLLDTGLPGLPVTDEWGSMAGFVSRTDILRAVAADPPLDLWS
jgi:CBS domain-containing protein